MNQTVNLTSQATVSDLLDSGLSPDDIAVMARRTQFDKAIAAVLPDADAKPLLTEDQAGAVCDMLLAPSTGAIPPDVTTCLTDLATALQARDAASVSRQVLTTLRAIILQRVDLVPLTVPVAPDPVVVTEPPTVQVA